MASQQIILSISLRALIPKSKLDIEAVERLAPLDELTLAPLIPHLLTWIQDDNWPIAWPVIQLLRKHPSIVVEHVGKVLRDEAGEADDGAWKNNCLESLVVEMDTKHRLLLKNEIFRMATSPTKDEIECETMDVAKHILDEMGIELPPEPLDLPKELKSESN